MMPCRNARKTGIRSALRRGVFASRAFAVKRGARRARERDLVHFAALLALQDAHQLHRSQVLCVKRDRHSAQAALPARMQHGMCGRTHEDSRPMPATPQRDAGERKQHQVQGVCVTGAGPL